MPRARVSPEKRKRTARACDSCKRSKLKCNGVHPCSTCSKDGRTCTFGGAPHVPDVRSRPLKRQMLDDGSVSTRNIPQSIAAQLHFPPHLISFEPPKNKLQPIPQPLHSPALITPLQHPEPSSPFPINSPPVPIARKADPVGYQDPLKIHSSGGEHVTGAEEEAVIYNFPRLLEDPSGRLQYLGDSATLSYLQIIRQDVESIDGPSPFTTDPNQHHIVENTTTLPRNIRNTNLLPEKVTAEILVESFFTNTSGLFRVFDEEFSTKLDSYYSDPLHVESNWLCLFNLTLAIGLVLATPIPGTHEDSVIKNLRGSSVDQAELFYSNARNLCDPVTGFENADLWSVQALLLMAIYTLAVSKRNAAFAYCGMASRSGFALGLHREETLAIFSDKQQTLRRNLWRSVFVLDCFLAASMGRPTSILEDDCQVKTFNAGNQKNPSVSSSFPTPITGQSSTLGLEASVRSCRVIGTILRRVYSKRKISTKLAQEIADECGLWPETLHPVLHSRQMTSASVVYPSQGISILHVNLIYCHTVILLTRPFFLFLLNKVQKERTGSGQRPRRHGSRIENFSECCVSASCHSIFLAQNALDSHYLSYRNPFVIYFVFAAALIVLTNEFFKVYAIPKASSLIEGSITIMGTCKETDPIANRLHFILTSFRDVVDRQRAYIPKRQITIKSEDPILSFLCASTNNNGTEDVSPNITRRSSFASVPTGGLGPLTGGITGIGSISIPPQLSSVVAPEISPDRIPRHGSLDGNDSLGDGEIDFDAFWNPHSRANNNNIVPAATQKPNTSVVNSD